MTFYEFQVVYSSDGKVLFCQCTGNEDETETRPLSVWLGKRVKDKGVEHLIAQWYSKDETVPNMYKEITAEQAIGNLEDEIWIAYHESGSYYDTSLETYSEDYIDEQNRRLLLLTKQGL